MKPICNFIITIPLDFYYFQKHWWNIIKNIDGIMPTHFASNKLEQHT
jgi:hypothetical protein